MLESLPVDRRTLFLESLNHDEAQFFRDFWPFWAREEQLAPEGNWRIWLFLGGRGAGKTRAGAEWIAEGIREGRMRRVALLAATYADARQVMIEGESGLKRVIPGATFEPSNRRVLFEGGAVATVLTAEEPDGIRGHQFDAAWGDEFAKWNAPQEALDMLLMAMRLGDCPQALLTTTPRNIAPLRALIAAPDTVCTKSTTLANKENLAPGFVEALEARYGGTRLGRQELDADIIEDNDAALWRRSWIEDARLRTAPPLKLVVIGVDPPASSHGDECGIVVAGIDETNTGYVLADCSEGDLTPSQWAARVAEAFERHEADLVVAEANQGGEMVRSVLLQAASNLPVKLVHATRDKRTRAMPIAHLYERGSVRHAGTFAALEDQMCTYDGEGPSPDRLDALVWAFTDLFPNERRAEPKIRTI